MTATQPTSLRGLRGPEERPGPGNRAAMTKRSIQITVMLSSRIGEHGVQEGPPSSAGTLGTTTW